MSLFPRVTPKNATVDALQVFCGYPLSATYGLMPRALLYPLLWMALYSRTSFMIVMLMTSVASIHLIGMAKNHSSSVLDPDIFPAYSATQLGLLFAPAYITSGKPLQGVGLRDRPVACLWMILLWAGVVSFTASMKYQPPATPCLDAHGHNISSPSHLSHCTFQCHNQTSHHAFRSGQDPILIQTSDSYYMGPGHTDHIVIWGLILIVPLMLSAFYVTGKEARIEETRRQINNDLSSSLFEDKDHRRRKNERDKLTLAKTICSPRHAAGLGFFLVVWFIEDALAVVPEMDRHDSVTQWGPLVAAALVFLAISARWWLGSRGQQRQGLNVPLRRRPRDERKKRRSEGVDVQRPEPVHLDAVSGGGGGGGGGDEEDRVGNIPNYGQSPEIWMDKC